MAQFLNMYSVDLQKPTGPQPLRQMVCAGDNAANRIGAIVTSDGGTVSLGGSCVGKVVRADGTTVQLSGTISGNQAYVVLDQASCAIVGQIQVAVCWVSGSNVTTLVIAYGSVVSTQTGSPVQPSTPIPDLTQLLAEIENMRTATAAATAAATGALANFAGAFDETAVYTAGQYVTYTNGKFYRLTADHAANVTWANTSKVAVTTGGELIGLKQAIATENANIMANFAGAFVQATAYPAGTYVTYTDGNLYVLPSGHEANATWANTTKTQVTVGGEFSELKSAFSDITGSSPVSMTIGRFVNLGSSSVTLDGGTPKMENAVSVACAVISASEGDLFTVSGKRGSSNALLYGFVKSDGTILEKQTVNTTEDKVEHIAPANTAWLVINVDKNSAYAIYAGRVNQWEKTQESFDTVDDVLDIINSTLSRNDIYELHGNYYGNLNGSLTSNSNWRAYKVTKDYFVSLFTHYGTFVNNLAVGFYNSDTTFSESTFISGIPYSSGSIKNIIMPTGTKTILLFHNVSTSTDVIIKGYLYSEVTDIYSRIIPKAYVNDVIVVDRIVGYGAYYINGNGNLTSNARYRAYVLYADECDLHYFRAGLASLQNMSIAYYSSKTTLDSTTCLGTKKIGELTDPEIPAGTKTIIISNYLDADPAVDVSIKVYPKNALSELLIDKSESEKPYTYEGKQVFIPGFNYFARFPMTGLPGGQQDGANYNGTLFRFDEYGNIHVYNMNTGELIGTGAIDEDSTVCPYFNSCFFANNFYAEGDEFPILYATGRGVYKAGGALPERHIYGFRIVRNGTTYIAYYVQYIALDSSFEYGTYGAFGYDANRNMLVGYSYSSIPSNTTYVFETDMPTYADGDTIIPLADITSFSFASPYLGAPQGCTCNNSKIYALGGNINIGTLDVIDLIDQKPYAHIDLASAGLTGEPQMIDVFDNHLWVGMMSNAYEFEF